MEQQWTLFVDMNLPGAFCTLQFPLLQLSPYLNIPGLFKTSLHMGNGTMSFREKKPDIYIRKLFAVKNSTIIVALPQLVHIYVLH